MPGYPCCCGPGCCTGAFPETQVVRIEGVLDTVNCADCAATFNDDFVVEDTPPFDCTWEYVADITICGPMGLYIVKVRLVYEYAAGPGWSIVVYVEAGVPTLAIFRLTLGATRPHCLLEDDLDIPLDTDGAYWCDFSGATCTINPSA
jgi:hypothetical protein